MRRSRHPCPNSSVGPTQIGAVRSGTAQRARRWPADCRPWRPAEASCRATSAAFGSAPCASSASTARDLPMQRRQHQGRAAARIARIDRDASGRAALAGRAGRRSGPPGAAPRPHRRARLCAARALERALAALRLQRRLPAAGVARRCAGTAGELSARFRARPAGGRRRRLRPRRLGAGARRRGRSAPAVPADWCARLAMRGARRCPGRCARRVPVRPPVRAPASAAAPGERGGEKTRHDQ